MKPDRKIFRNGMCIGFFLKVCCHAVLCRGRHTGTSLSVLSKIISEINVKQVKLIAFVRPSHALLKTIFSTAIQS